MWYVYSREHCGLRLISNTMVMYIICSFESSIKLEKIYIATTTLKSIYRIKLFLKQQIVFIQLSNRLECCVQRKHSYMFFIYVAFENIGVLWEFLNVILQLSYIINIMWHSCSGILQFLNIVDEFLIWWNSFHLCVSFLQLFLDYVTQTNQLRKVLCTV